MREGKVYVRGVQKGRVYVRGVQKASGTAGGERMEWERRRQLRLTGLHHRDLLPGDLNLAADVWTCVCAYTMAWR